MLCAKRVERYQMKQLKHKVKKLINRKKKTEEPEVSAGRITNETVAEHREQILAGGRRFKYPMQYAKHRLVINSILISAGALLLLFILLWVQLYLVQGTSNFMYRISQFVPAPVANVDGTFVRYSDYLMELRSELFYLQRQEGVNFNSTDGKQQLSYLKRRTLNKVEDYAYVRKLAKDLKVNVSDEEVTTYIDSLRQRSGRQFSRDLYEQIVIKGYYDWSLTEYEYSLKNQLLRRKVAIKIDEPARRKANQILDKLNGGADFAAVAKESSDDDITKNIGGDAGVVNVTDEDPDGLIIAANKLEPGKHSGVIETKNGYYIVKLLEKKDGQVHFARILVSLRELDDRLEDLRKKNKVAEYIGVPKEVTPVRQE
jgi:hypothetical protein